VLKLHATLWLPQASDVSPLVQLALSTLTYLPSPCDRINTERLPLLGCETLMTLKWQEWRMTELAVSSYRTLKMHRGNGARKKCTVGNGPRVLE